MRFLSSLRAAAVLVLLVPRSSPAQDRGAPLLDQLVRGLTVTPRVLVIGAHPDDENTNLIAFLARGRRVETAYLSLTRGDGGQNLIGSDLGEALGAIRTEELLAARRVDGGRQFFTRAYDFGFSKTAEETFRHWPHEEVLADVVTVIRSFRPHVIASVWSGTRNDGHGHHEASGILAREAFDAAGDTVRFPIARYGRPWEPLKLFRGGFGGGGGRGGGPGGGGRANVLNLPPAVVGAERPLAWPPVPINIAEYDPVLGRTAGEIAAESRSQHRSQGFAGVALRGSGGRGASITLSLAASRVGDRAPAAATEAGGATVPPSIFDGIDTSFARLAAGAPLAARRALELVQVYADSARFALDLARPQSAVRFLGRAAQAAAGARAAAPFCGHPSQDAVSLTANAIVVPPPPDSAGIAGTASERAVIATQDALAVDPPCSPRSLDLDASLDLVARRTAEALVAAAGVSVTAVANRELIAYRDAAPVTVSVANRGAQPVRVERLQLSGLVQGPAVQPQTILPDSEFAASRFVAGLVDPNPWWLGQRIQDLFPPAESPIDGLARATVVAQAPLVNAVAIPEDIRRTSDVSVTLTIAGATVTLSVGPIVFRTADPLLGVQDRPVAGVPSVTLTFDRGLEWIPAGKPIDRLIRLTMRSLSDSAKRFAFKVIAPQGIRIDSLPKSVTLESREQRELFLRMRGVLKPGRYEFGVAGVYDDSSYFAEGFRSIEYPHIRPLRIFSSSGIWLQAVNVEVPRTLAVAYVQGVGDVIAPYLRQLGMSVTVVQPEELPALDLSRFTTVVVGTRAFEAKRELLAYVPRLMDFAKAGGTLVVQYGQQPGSTPQIFPHPVQFRGQLPRVTEENAHVTVLNPRAKVLTWPNRISESDWRDWVQERSVYMPTAIDARYMTPVEMHDPGEPENKGAILVTPLGKGTYVYTTLAFFRQIPGAVPGGARLMVNLLSAGLSEQPGPR